MVRCVLSLRDTIQANSERLIRGARGDVNITTESGERIALASDVTTPAHASATRPNILFFFVDDMGWQDTSVPFHAEQTELNRRYRTPHMERLAKAGMKFTQAYASHYARHPGSA